MTIEHDRWKERGRGINSTFQGNGVRFFILPGFGNR